MTPANTLYETGGTIRRCLMCRDESLRRRLRRRHKPRPPETGWCMKGLHEWVPENWYTDQRGTQRCKPCRDVAHAIVYARTVVIHCVVKGCNRLTHRGAETGNYICKNHRAEPPDWIARLGLRIVGTRLE